MPRDRRSLLALLSSVILPLAPSCVSTSAPEAESPPPPPPIVDTAASERAAADERAVLDQVAAAAERRQRLLALGAGDGPASQAPVARQFASRSTGTEASQGRPAVSAQVQPPAVTAPAATEPAPPSAVERREADVAAIIGVETYQSLPSATGAEQDATTFRSYAEQTLGVAPRHVIALLGATATRSRIDVLLDEELPRLVGPQSTVYFYFAGHGAPDVETLDPYLVPWEADARFIARQGVSLESVVRRLNALRAGRVVVFLDACFSGGGRGARTLLPEGMRPIVTERGVRTIPVRQHERAFALLAAAGEGQVTGMTDDRRHGLFSYHLFRALSGSADADGDRRVTWAEVARFVRNQVADAAAHQGRSQEPTTHTSAQNVDALELVRLPPASP